MDTNEHEGSRPNRNTPGVGRSNWHYQCYARCPMNQRKFSRASQCSKLALCIVATICLGCSKSDVKVVTQPSPEGQKVSAPAPMSVLPQKNGAERLVEIDRLLAMPITGRSDEVTQRSRLRAERESLMASGQFPFWTRTAQKNPSRPSSVNHQAQSAQLTHL